MPSSVMRLSMRAFLCAQHCMIEVTEWEGERSIKEFESTDFASENLTI